MTDLVAPKERPILFSAPMVRAILAGRKTQTRRVVKPQPSNHIVTRACMVEGNPPMRGVYWEYGGPVVYCPYGRAGDRLWVRETWARNWNQLSETCTDRSYVYRADGETRAQDNGTDLPWKPSIHMPRAACRLVLEVTGARVERLQDISEADAIAEGAEPYRLPVHPAREQLRHVDGFHSLWESINGPASWDANPWVWVVEFNAPKQAAEGASA